MVEIWLFDLPVADTPLWQLAQAVFPMVLWSKVAGVHAQPSLEQGVPQPTHDQDDPQPQALLMRAPNGAWTTSCIPPVSSKKRRPWKPLNRLGRGNC